MNGEDVKFEREKRIRHFFIQLLSDIPDDLLPFVLCAGDQDNAVYMYDFDTGTARKPDGDELEWPVTFLCTAFHRKTVFQPKRAPPLRSISNSLFEWERRARWRLYFKSLPGALGEEVSSVSQMVIPQA